MTLAELRAEYSATRIGPLILGEIEESARRVAPSRYPPRIYARAEEWADEAINDLVQDVTLHRLLDGGQLDYVMAMSVDLHHFRSLLDRQVHHELVSRRTKTLIDNVLSRCRDILDQPPFDSSVGPGGRTAKKLYMLAGRDLESRPPTPSELRIAAAVVRQVPRLGDFRGEKASPVYTAQNLAAALNLVGQTLSSRFSLADLDKIFSEILTAWRPEFLTEIEADAMPSESLGPEHAAVLRQTAQSVLRQLTTSQKHHFRLIMAGCSFDETARSLGISRPTEGARRAEISRVFETALGELSEPLQRAAIDEVFSHILMERSDDEPEP